MSEKSYYDILEINRNADIHEIKKAYRRLAMQYHPDKNPNDKSAEDKFKEIGEAYAVLSDPQKRNQYDRFGKAGARGMGGFDGFGMGGSVDPMDIFREFFSGSSFEDLFRTGSSRRRSSARRGSDLQVPLKLTLEEIAKGVKKTIKLKKHLTCSSCQGSGASAGSNSTTCQTCHGRGEVAFRQGFFSVTQTCQRCGGEGRVIENPCSKCNGEGRVRGEDKIEIDIPAGISEGQYITVRNAGNAGPRGGGNGDLLVIIHQEPHELFERHGDDLVFNLYLGFTQVALGDEVEVPTINGKAKISIAPGTQGGKILRLRSKGLPHLNATGSGDQLVRIFVFIPTKLNTKEKQLLKELSQQSNLFPSNSDKSLFDRMKEAMS